VTLSEELLQFFAQHLSEDPAVAAKQRELLILARDQTQPERAAEIRGILEALLAEVMRGEDSHE
jgi:hypothetical protein